MTIAGIVKQMTGMTRREASRAVEARAARASQGGAREVRERVSRNLDQLNLGTRHVQAAAESRARLLGKFPTLDAVVRDPDAFVKDIQSRFAAQKRVDPAHPYRFDFSDYGIPVIKDWRELLSAEMKEVQDRKFAHLGKHPMGSTAEHDTALSLINKISREIDGHMARGTINYERLQELSDYMSRALGRFDRQDLSLMHRIMLPMDEKLQGYTPTTAAQDLIRYEKNRHRQDFFDGTTPLPAANKSADRAFVSDRYNHQELKMISLPTSEPLNDEIFERTIPRNIYLEGVSREPILADGFNRPSKLFREHDVRHNQVVHRGLTQYRQVHDLSDVQIEKLNRFVDVWRQELRDWKNGIDDPAFRKAVDLIDFHLYHDRGFPSVPSSFDTRLPVDEHIQWALYAAEKLGSQEMGFNDPRLMRQAYDQLREFWQARRPQEEAIWKGLI